MQDFDNDVKRFHALCDAKRVSEALDVVRDLARRANLVREVAELGFAFSRVGWFEDAEHAFDAVWPHLSEWERYIGTVGRERNTVKFHLGKIAEAVAFEEVVYGRQWYRLPHVEGMADADAINQRVRERLLTGNDSVRGKSVFMLLAGGAGDAIEQLRYAEHLVAEGARVVYANPQESLRELIVHSALPLTLDRTTISQLDRYEVFAFGHLLHYRYPRAGVSAPAQTHYLRPASAAAPASGSAGVQGKLRIGLVWRSTNATWHTCRHEPFRSIDLAELEPLLAESSVQFYSLHFGATTLEEQALLARYGVSDPAREIRSFADLADVMMQLDGVVTIDSAPAHLAGALGVPVWNLLAAVSDWRWSGLAQLNGPLYPSMTLLRQLTLGDWAPVIAEMAARLRALSPTVSR